MLGCRRGDAGGDVSTRPSALYGVGMEFLFFFSSFSLHRVLFVMI